MANTINIKTISKILEKNAVARKVFAFGIKVILHILVGEKLIDFRQLEKASLNWERGTLQLGDNFGEMLVGRAISEYVVKGHRRKLEVKMRERVRSEYNRESRKPEDQ